MQFIVLIIVGLVEVGLAVGALYFLVAKGSGSSGGAVDELTKELNQRKELVGRLDQLLSSMVDIPTVRLKAKELKLAEESLKAERGRITITQAELETIEARLRELEEIERELEASGIEAKEELNILRKKQADLAQKNAQLKSQIEASIKQIDAQCNEIEMSSQVKEQIQNMKTELMQTEQKIDQMVLQLELSNDQYFILKKRYDALDIEYAQLYEKFTEAEAMLGAKQKS